MPYSKLQSSEIFYQDVKPRDGLKHILLFIHGAGGNSLTWSGQVGYSFGNSRLLIPELPCHGASKGESLDSIDRYTSVMMDFLDSLQINKVIPVGHSMGGAVALNMAINYSYRIEAIILIDTSALLPVNRIIFDKLKEGSLSAAKLICKFSFSQSTSQILIDKTITEMAKCPANVLENDFIACNEFNQSGNLYTITQPTLILCGEEDKMTPPANSEFLNNEIIDSELVFVKNAGHMAMLEKPTEVNEAIHSFLRTISSLREG
jgi:pimeloyl-ACP methyl ester carboxylesterase